MLNRTKQLNPILARHECNGILPNKITRWGKYTYVKSCKITLAGLKGISVSALEFSTQLRIVSTSADWTLNSSQFLTADSSSTLMEYGRVSSVKYRSQTRVSWLLTKSGVSQSWELVESTASHGGLDAIEWIFLWAS